MGIKELVDKLVEDGVITSSEHEEFINLVHKDGVVDDEESAQIARVFSMISEGTLKVVDEDREQAEAFRAAEANAKR